MKGLLLGRARLEEEAVQSVLQLSNVSNLSAYVFGSKNISSAELPVAQVWPFCAKWQNRLHYMLLMARAVSMLGSMFCRTCCAGMKCDLRDAGTAVSGGE